MSFYLKPPKGSLNIHLLTKCVEQRLKCYDCIKNSTNLLEILSDCECLIEDSSLDRTGHYILRLAAYKSIIFRAIFIDNECNIFMERLRHCNEYGNIKFLIKKILRHSLECFEQVDNEEFRDYFLNLTKLCTKTLRKEFLQHVTTTRCIYDSGLSCIYSLKVPFYLCPDLVSQRKVQLIKGYAEIDCLQWPFLFLALFRKYLNLTLKEMHNSQQVKNTLTDDRISDIIENIISDWCCSTSQNCENVKFDIRNIENELQYFPLCMQNLYGTLKRNNRLSHNARFDFSLYLKGIGVPMLDALKFWEQTYTKQHASCSRCTHSWKENAKRYIYGIRHLYGLEGARKNYRVRSCNYLQGITLSATEEGGCPFVHFDDIHLKRTLNKVLNNDEAFVDAILDKRKNNQYNDACILFTTNLRDTASDKLVFYDPVQYYFLLTGQKRYSYTL